MMNFSCIELPAVCLQVDCGSRIGRMAAQQHARSLLPGQEACVGYSSSSPVTAAVLHACIFVSFCITVLWVTGALIIVCNVTVTGFLLCYVSAELLWLLQEDCCAVVQHWVRRSEVLTQYAYLFSMRLWSG
jgi:hypothetical protein